ncbi:MAG: capsule assembly Wzi family protein [Candidatus Azobacteroides sp.]|nr:capsule assembly Wzi family protein [Candidatus Azobacteroides sp.]
MNNLLKLYLSTLAVFAGILNVFGQMETSYRASAYGSVASGEHTPFWMVNHNWGMTALDANNFHVRGGIFHQQRINNDWSWDAGIDLAGGSSSPYGKVWVQQLYGRLNWKIWRIDMGSREEYVSYLNPYLSSGDFTNSNNARPIPQLKGSIPDFILIPYTKGNMFFKGDCSIGKYLDGQWLEDKALPTNSDYARNILSHSKSLYFRFGDIETRHKMQFTFGIVHVAQWGGVLYRYEQSEEGEWHYTVQHQPEGVGDFLRIFVAKEGASSSSLADQEYAAGSQWGTYLFKWDYKLANDDRLSIYLDHFFEDGSGMVFENYKDGIWGLEYKTKKKNWISGAVFEYIYTKQQTGPIHFNITMDDEHRSKLIHKGNGNDNYYYNVDYTQGPSYFGKTMGTPLFLSPEYNTGKGVNFQSNRICSFHLGLEGYCHPKIQYRLLLTTGQTWGRYYVPYRSVRSGFASQLELIYHPAQLNDWNIKLSMAGNTGEFFGGDTFGAGITLTKQGIIYAK